MSEERKEKVCLACTKADFSKVSIADFCGVQEPYFEFTCTDCSLIGPYRKYDHEKMSVYFNPFGKIEKGHRFWVDGGQSTEYCDNFELRDDHGITGKAKEP